VFSKTLLVVVQLDFDAQLKKFHLRGGIKPVAVSYLGQMWYVHLCCV